MDASEPIVFKVFYEEEVSNCSTASGVKGKSDEVRKIVFASTPNFGQLHDRLLRIEDEKYNNKENIGSVLLPKYVRIKYIDEDGDRISIACDADLENVIEEKVRKICNQKI